ncbi:hypothetical protein [Corallococcus sicarius]|uniref:Uncharacterized protein n=1 Tax=Corallococcus sicarius TaxID=2316726 RepID=A0A3A8NKW7_9BACT|nr:hypothetical protein [Corallococcus sicarius]RKH40084.1 hypothetical protein D7X12_21780 [Corallococcus sicarius]
MNIPASLFDFSLVQGGLLVGPGRRHLLALPRRSSLPGRVLTLTLVAWLPLLLLSLLHGGSAVPRAFLRDAAVHVQLLVSLPLLIATERYIDLSVAAAVRQFVVSELIDAKHLGAFEDIARGVMQVRGKASLEAGLLLAAFALSFVQLSASAAPGWSHTEPDGPLTFAGGWYLAVSRPLVRFLLLRWLLRGALWAVFLFRVSRLPLALVPTHPDAAGGLGFLGTCQASFSSLVFAVGCTLTAQRLRWAPSSDLLGYATHLLAFALLALVVLFVPLLPFCRPLLLAKRHGDHAFSGVAAWHSRRFERRWFHREEPAGVDPLSAPDFSSLTDLGTSFATARDMRWLPVNYRAALAILCAAMAPMVPLLFIDRRFIAVLTAVGKSLL